jgi:asparagine synthase (glutamine-hydrolysing)
MRKWGRALRRASPEDVFSQMATHWGADWLLNGRSLPDHVGSHLALVKGLPSLTERMMACDAMTYLPDDILVKVDRASMAVSLESRVPLLDHRLVEFAFRLPAEKKVRNGQGKWLLRQVLQQYVPPELVERPKMGFGVPIEHWLRGPLREWAEPLLGERQLEDQGFFSAKTVRRVWERYLSGQTYYGPELWSILMFQAWLERQ